MSPWSAAALTAGLPLLLALGAALAWYFDRFLWAAGLAALLPCGLAAGYLAAGLPWRGLAVVAGGYGVLALGAGLLMAAPKDFEDAGVLVSGLAGLTLVACLAYAGWAAWDVYRSLG